ncbi:MAG: adenylate/guanylate cyclase domain-containing protein [Myxococcaceae bacterium]|nr:adenylate/guanylate cyclase domain-containing protein [Myxococcaceae bacterium]
MESSELTREELLQLRSISRTLDDLLEEALKNRENLEQTFRRVLPLLLPLTGAVGVAVRTNDEELHEHTWHHGTFGGTFPGTWLAEKRFGVHKTPQGTWVAQSLDLVGVQVGAMGLFFDASSLLATDAARMRTLDAIAEELDTVLASVHTASEKHQLLMTINRFLSNRVFDIGMDQAVLALCERVRLPGFLLVHRDAIDTGALHYRVYRDGRLESSSGGKRHCALDDAITAYGQTLLANKDAHLTAALQADKAAEAVLISGINDNATLGKILVWSNGQGFSAYTRDLIHLLASALSQRLVDYNRERIHLSQFFAPPVIDELLKDPDYEQRYLTPRDEEVGILFADINGFTKICEQVLVRPDRIGKFVDEWTAEAVRILYAHGGVFDKMVGDCVIGLFGPPFFRSSRADRAAAVMQAAVELQAFTQHQMSAYPDLARLPDILKVPGLGVAIGVNLAPTFCGLFGPNRQYTGFSTGMNSTARLQSLGGFRETLVMQSVQQALAAGKPELLEKWSLGPLSETAVKNVGQPLKYFKLL